MNFILKNLYPLVHSSFLWIWEQLRCLRINTQSTCLETAYWNILFTAFNNDKSIHDKYDIIWTNSDVIDHTLEKLTNDRYIAKKLLIGALIFVTLKTVELMSFVAFTKIANSRSCFPCERKVNGDLNLYNHPHIFKSVAICGCDWLSPSCMVFMLCWQRDKS